MAKAKPTPLLAKLKIKDKNGTITKAEKKKLKQLLIAYTPLTEAEKEKQRKQLIEDLKKGKKGLYHSPGGNRYHI